MATNGTELAVVQQPKDRYTDEHPFEEVELNERSPTDDNNIAASSYTEDPLSQYRWVIVACTFVVTMLCIGLNYSIGPFVEDLGKLLSEYNYNKKEIDIKWVVYISIFLTFFTALFAGPLANTQRIGPRVTAFCGAILSTAGLFASTFVMSTTTLCVTYGVLTGVGYGLLLTPCLGLIPRYFQSDRKNCDLANALAFLGTSISIFFMPSLYGTISDKYGRRYVFAILACLNAQLLLVSLLLRPIKRANGNNQSQRSSDTQQSDTPKATTLRDLLDVELLRKPLFVVMVIAMFFIGLGHHILVIHLRQHAYKGGNTESQSDLLLIVFGIALVVGLVMQALASLPLEIWENTDTSEKARANLTDKIKLAMFSLSLAVVGLVAIFSFQPDTFEGHLAITAMIGIGAGIYLPLTVSILRVFIRGIKYEKANSINSKWRVTAALGLSLPVYGLGALVGLSVGDKINEDFDNYNSSYFLAGVSLIFACAILLVRGMTQFICVAQRQQRRDHTTTQSRENILGGDQPTRIVNVYQQNVMNVNVSAQTGDCDCAVEGNTQRQITDGRPHFERAQSEPARPLFATV
ncbi:monocarboxylate transporter 13-like [Glandiceps talaboti]